MRRWITGAVIAFGAACAAAQMVPAYNPEKAATAPIAADERILHQLGDASFDVREAAQARLEALPGSAIDQVRGWLANTNDPEVKVRLNRGIAGIEKNAAMHPKGISLDLTNATLQGVVDAMNRSAGETIVQAGAPATAPAPAVPQPSEEARFTIHMKDAAFWEIIKELDRQSPLNTRWPGKTGEDWKPHSPMLLIPGGVRQYFEVSGPFRLVPRGWSNPAKNGALSLAWGVNLTITNEPRVTMAQHAVLLDVTEMVDDTGQDLAKQVTVDGGAMQTPIKALPNGNAAAILEKVSRARTIVRIKGSYRISIWIGCRRVIFDPAEQLNQPLAWDWATFTLTRYSATEAAVSMTSSLERFDGKTNGSCTLRAVDADGNVSAGCVGVYGGNYGGAVKPPSAKGPYKVELTAPEDVVTVAIPFEFKDIDIPVPKP